MSSSLLILFQMLTCLRNSPAIYFSESLRAGWGVMAICLMIDFEFKAKLVRMHPSQNKGGAERNGLREDCY